MFFEILLGAFVKLRKVTISFRPSVCPQGTVWPLLEVFICNSMFKNFSKICQECSILIKS